MCTSISFFSKRPILSMNPVEFDPISRHFKGKNNGAGNYLTLTSVATIVAPIE